MPSGTGLAGTGLAGTGLAGAGTAARRAARAATPPSGTAARPVAHAGASAAPTVTHRPPAQRVTERTALLWPARRGAAALVAAAASPGP